MTARTDIIQAQLEDGTIIKIRASLLTKEENVSDEKLPPLPLNGVMETVENIAHMLSKTIQKVKPQKASIEFGLEIAVDAGQITALLVDAKGASHLNITLEWSDSNKT